MLILPNGCKCTTPKVSPKNWQDPAINSSVNWVIFYRFYHPDLPGPKLIRIKGMNEYKDLKQRRAITKEMIKLETERLMEGFNPVTGRMNYELEPVQDFPLGPDMPMAKALHEAIKFINAEKSTIACIKSVVKGFCEAAAAVGLDHKRISQVSRKDIKLVLEKCSQLRTRWSDNQYNVYRSHISMCFVPLMEFEAVAGNPVRDLQKKRAIVKARKTLTPHERRIVSEHLKNSHYRFWLYMQMFFHSGSRTKELFRMKVRDVNLEDGKFRIIIKKGQDLREVWRPIKNIAMPYWEEYLKGANPDHFLVGRGFFPDDKAMEPNRVSRVWKKLVKDPKTSGGLSINIDFYALKHLNIDETAAILTIEDAAKMAGHTTPVITLKHYALGEKERQSLRLKSVNNPFGD